MHRTLRVNLSKKERGSISSLSLFLGVSFLHCHEVNLIEPKQYKIICWLTFLWKTKLLKFDEWAALYWFEKNFAKYLKKVPGLNFKWTFRDFLLALPLISISVKLTVRGLQIEPLPHLAFKVLNNGNTRIVSHVVLIFPLLPGFLL